MDILSPHGEETTSVQALRKALLSLGSDRSEADFPTDGGFSERVPLKVLILTQATHRLFEALEDGPTKVPAKRKQVVSGPWVPAEDVVKAGGATGKPAPFPSISRSIVLSMRSSETPAAARVCNEDEADELSHDESAASDYDPDDEVIVGPTPLAVQPLSFSELSIPGGESTSILSGVTSIRLSEVTRLKCPRGSSAEPLPLSYGSILHICGFEDRCRPCMFERSAGRCRKSWLCDFCHMHTGRKRKVTAVPWQKGKPA